MSMKNGISIAALSEMAHEIEADPAQGQASYGVVVQWLSGTRASVSTLPMMIGPHRVQRDFSWTIDEPRQLGGSNHGPNPQEYLLSGMGSCLMVAFAVGASVMGIQLSQLEVTVQAKLDLAGFLQVRPDAMVPLQAIDYQIRVSGDGTPEQYEQLRQQAQAHSPNAMSLQQGVRVSGTLEAL